MAKVILTKTIVDRAQIKKLNLRIKHLENKVKACDDLFISFNACILSVGSSDKAFKRSLNILQKNITKYKSIEW